MRKADVWRPGLGAPERTGWRLRTLQAGVVIFAVLLFVSLLRVVLG
jgi:hypothetical protein